jgi:hypothetical protein|mmetsp:Transcript_73603/g.124020  ORF Transcript_73603/g.124020 Transcript_73603/m.124020 type:complete len:105 (-) Transcript_73603:4202-4516(-)
MADYLLTGPMKRASRIYKQHGMEKLRVCTATKEWNLAVQWLEANSGNNYYVTLWTNHKPLLATKALAAQEIYAMHFLQSFGYLQMNYAVCFVGQGVQQGLLKFF